MRSVTIRKDWENFKKKLTDRVKHAPLEVENRLRDFGLFRRA